MHFIFFQPAFLNRMLCFLNSLRHIVKTKVSFNALLNELASTLGNRSEKDIIRIKQSCIRTLAQYTYATFLWAPLGNIINICKPLVVNRFYYMALYHCQMRYHLINNFTEHKPLDFSIFTT